MTGRIIWATPPLEGVNQVSDFQGPVQTLP